MKIQALQKYDASYLIALLAYGVFALTLAGCNLSAQQHNVQGRQAFEYGHFSNAINEFQQALSANPQNANAYYNLGASYYALGKQTKNQQWATQAEQLYRQAISLDDQHTDAHRGLAALLIETNREQFAFDLLNQWKQRYPGSTDPYVELARVYQEYGDTRRATDLLADALQINPNSVRALKSMGLVRETQGQMHLALDNYLRVLQLDRQQTAVAQRVASLQQRLAALPVQNGAASNNPQLGNTPSNTNPARYGAVDPYLTR